MKCKQCYKDFDPVRKDNIFCSKYCREKNWRLNNKDRIKEFSKKYRLKNPIFCCFCKKEIDLNDRVKGVRFCSEECRKSKRKLNAKKHRIKIFKKFHRFKKNKGCKRCGYNKCGASLDFHHIGRKDRRITATMWYGNSKIIKKELKRCILLCKNCHYEIHNGFSLELNE